MSTGGSVRSGGARAPLTPTADGPPPPTAPRTKRVAIFRWRGIFALAFGFALALLGWFVYGRIWVRHTLQD